MFKLNQSVAQLNLPNPTDVVSAGTKNVFKLNQSVTLLNLPNPTDVVSAGTKKRVQTEPICCTTKST